ncbi:MAG: NAD+ synthase [Planctomycetaceae bacterium]|nr:NAD+ synthase [Planctomycetaceae bacterium]
MRLALVQLNPTVGDLGGNCAKMVQAARCAQSRSADLIVFPELCLCGYPPEDLLFRTEFLERSRTALEQFARCISDQTVIAGCALKLDSHCYNTASIIEKGAIQKIYRKILLPNYGVFDEKRYFHPGDSSVVLDKDGFRVAVTICEDLWDLQRLDAYLDRTQGLDLIINIAASPFHAGKSLVRQQVLTDCAAHFNCAVAYCNLVGGQDELVFDGRSLVMDARGRQVARASAFDEDCLMVDISKNHDAITLTPVDPQETAPLNELEEIWQALVVGTRDYVRKNGFTKAALGLSGGIDSSLVAAIAAEALDKENVIGISMPSRFNSPQTQSDAARVAENLQISFHTVPISEPLQALSRALDGVEGWNEHGLAYENLQARIRGTLLMSWSNQFGWLVLTTGNKSETAVGYTTLYGDSAGGFAVIKDVPKTMVYQLCRYVNKKAGREVIPNSVISRIPSAELRDNQKDSDSLPEYDILDAILKLYVEQGRSADQIVKEGFNEAQVSRVIRLVDRSEFKRRQSPPGVRITPLAFGRDRRMPITNRFNA